MVRKLKRQWLSIFTVLALLCATLCIAFIGFGTSASAEAPGPELLPLIPNETGVSETGYDTQRAVKLSADIAATNGVPVGYSGDVVRMGVGASGVGATFDFTPHNIEITSIKSISFRVYVGGNDGSANAPNFRISLGNSTWLYYNGDIAITVGSDGWSEYKITVGETKTNGNVVIDHNFLMKDSRFNGVLLKKFFVLFRHGGTSAYNDRSGNYYIDSITIERTGDEQLPLSVNYTGTVETAYAHSHVKEQTSVRVSANDINNAELGAKGVDYSGELVECSMGSEYSGAMFDYRNYNIAKSDIKRIIIRAYLPDPQSGADFRLYNKSNAWVFTGKFSVSNGNLARGWNIIYIQPTSSELDKLCDADGAHLGIFSVCVKLPAPANSALKMYIDGIYVDTGCDREADLPLIDNESGVSMNNYDTEPSFVYTEKAASLEVPSGYTGNVVRMGVGTQGVGATFDFTSQNIELDRIKSISFRIYTGGNDGSANAPNFRITCNGSAFFYYNGNITPTVDEYGWTTYKITVGETRTDSNVLIDSEYMKQSARFNGNYLTKFFVLFRHGGSSAFNNHSGNYFIDSVAVELNYDVFARAKEVSVSDLMNAPMLAYPVLATAGYPATGINTATFEPVEPGNYSVVLRYAVTYGAPTNHGDLVGVWTYGDTVTTAANNQFNAFVQSVLGFGHYQNRPDNIKYDQTHSGGLHNGSSAQQAAGTTSKVEISAIDVVSGPNQGKTLFKVRISHNGGEWETLEETYMEVPAAHKTNRITFGTANGTASNTKLHDWDYTAATADVFAPAKELSLRELTGVGTPEFPTFGNVGSSAQDHTGLYTYTPVSPNNYSVKLKYKVKFTAQNNNNHLVSLWPYSNVVTSHNASNSDFDWTRTIQNTYTINFRQANIEQASNGKINQPGWNALASNILSESLALDTYYYIEQGAIDVVAGPNVGKTYFYTKYSANGSDWTDVQGFYGVAGGKNNMVCLGKNYAASAEIYDYYHSEVPGDEVLAAAKVISLRELSGNGGKTLITRYPAYGTSVSGYSGLLTYQPVSPDNYSVIFKYDISFECTCGVFRTVNLWSYGQTVTGSSSNNYGLIQSAYSIVYRGNKISHNNKEGKDHPVTDQLHAGGIAQPIETFDGEAVDSTLTINTEYHIEQGAIDVLAGPNVGKTYFYTKLNGQLINAFYAVPAQKTNKISYGLAPDAEANHDGTGTIAGHTAHIYDVEHSTDINDQRFAAAAQLSIEELTGNTAMNFPVLGAVGTPASEHSGLYTFTPVSEGNYSVVLTYQIEPKTTVNNANLVSLWAYGDTVTGADSGWNRMIAAAYSVNFRGGKLQQGSNAIDQTQWGGMAVDKFTGMELNTRYLVEQGAVNVVFGPNEGLTRFYVKISADGGENWTTVQDFYTNTTHMTNKICLALSNSAAQTEDFKIYDESFVPAPVNVFAQYKSLSLYELTDSSFSSTDVPVFAAVGTAAEESGNVFTFAPVAENNYSVEFNYRYTHKSTAKVSNIVTLWSYGSAVTSSSGEIRNRLVQGAFAVSYYDGYMNNNTNNLLNQPHAGGLQLAAGFELAVNTTYFVRQGAVDVLSGPDAGNSLFYLYVNTTNASWTSYDDHDESWVQVQRFFGAPGARTNKISLGRMGYVSGEPATAMVMDTLRNVAMLKVLDGDRTLHSAEYDIGTTVDLGTLLSDSSIIGYSPVATDFSTVKKGSITLNNDVTLYPVRLTLALENGAAVRLKGTPALGYTVNISMDGYDKLGDAVVASGIVFANVSAFSGDELTLTTEGAIVKPLTETIAKNGTRSAQVYLDGDDLIPAARYGARGFVTVAFEDSQSVTYYTAYSAANNARSALDVAYAACADQSVSNYVRYELRELYINNILDIVYSSGAFAPTSGAAAHADYAEAEMTLSGGTLTVAGDYSFEYFAYNGEYVSIGGTFTAAGNTVQLLSLSDNVATFDFDFYTHITLSKAAGYGLSFEEVSGAVSYEIVDSNDYRTAIVFDETDRSDIDGLAYHNGTYTYTPFVVGKHNITVRAKDSFGNVKASSDTVASIEVAPQYAYTSIPYGYWLWSKSDIDALGDTARAMGLKDDNYYLYCRRAVTEFNALSNASKAQLGFLRKVGENDYEDRYTIIGDYVYVEMTDTYNSSMPFYYAGTFNNVDKWVGLNMPNASATNYMTRDRVMQVIGYYKDIGVNVITLGNSSYVRDSDISNDDRLIWILDYCKSVGMKVTLEAKIINESIRAYDRSVDKQKIYDYLAGAEAQRYINHWAFFGWNMSDEITSSYMSQVGNPTAHQQDSLDRVVQLENDIYDWMEENAHTNYMIVSCCLPYAGHLFANEAAYENHIGLYMQFKTRYVSYDVYLPWNTSAGNGTDIYLNNWYYKSIPVWAKVIKNDTTGKVFGHCIGTYSNLYDKDNNPTKLLEKADIMLPVAIAVAAGFESFPAFTSFLHVNMPCNTNKDMMITLDCQRTDTYYWVAEAYEQGINMNALLDGYKVDNITFTKSTVKPGSTNYPNYASLTSTFKKGSDTATMFINVTNPTGGETLNYTVPSGKTYYVYDAKNNMMGVSAVGTGTAISVPAGAAILVI